jgi:hypothetical protein
MGENQTQIVIRNNSYEIVVPEGGLFLPTRAAGLHPVYGKLNKQG